MSPAPARTSQDAIVTAARTILEADGLSAVTMRAVAESVGVKGPSLYKRLPDHAALLRAVSESVAADLTRTLAGAGDSAGAGGAVAVASVAVAAAVDSVAVAVAGAARVAGRHAARDNEAGNAEAGGSVPGEAITGAADPITDRRVDPHADSRADLRSVAFAYRVFVHANPNGYRLLFADLPAGARPDPSTLAAMGWPVVQAMARLIGEGEALEAARTVVAWAHGFVSMELAGAFRLGGDLDVAYAYGIDTILLGISGRATQASR